MKTLLKIIFNTVVYIFLYWLQVLIMLTICVGLGLWDPMGPVGGTPGVLGLVCLYTTYVILKQIHKIKFVDSFFNKL